MPQGFGLRRHTAAHLGASAGEAPLQPTPCVGASALVAAAALAASPHLRAFSPNHGDGKPQLHSPRRTGHFKTRPAPVIPFSPILRFFDHSRIRFVRLTLGLEHTISRWREIGDSLYCYVLTRPTWTSRRQSRRQEKEKGEPHCGSSAPHGFPEDH